MRSVFMIVVSNIRGRKVKSLIAGFCFAVCAFLFCLSLGILQSIQNPFWETFNRLHGSQMHFLANGTVYDIDALAAWFGNQPNLEGVHIIPTVSIMDEYPYLTKKDTVAPRVKLETILLASEYMGTDKLDRLQIVHGAGDEQPKPGEVWLPTTLAKQFGIAVGDIFEVPTANGYYPFTVSAIVVDPQFSAAISLNPKRIWLAPGELSWHFTAAALKNSIIGARFDTEDHAYAAWDDFCAMLGGAFNGMNFESKLLASIFGMTFTIIAAILIIVSVLFLAIAIFVVYTSIHGAILADYRQLGILKSTGFTPQDLILTYGLQFLLIAIGFVPVGVFCSFLGLKVFSGQFLLSLGYPAGSASLICPAIATGALICIGVFLASCLIARQAGRIKAVDAIRMGEAPQKIGGARFVTLEKSEKPLVWLMALKSLFSRKRRLVMSCITAMLCSFIFFFCVNMNEFFNTSALNPEFWGGDSSDIALTRNGKRFAVDRAVLQQTLAANEEIAFFTAIDYGQVAIPASPGKKSSIQYGSLYAGNMDQFKLRNINGQNPRSSLEVSLGVSTAKQYKLKVGDNLELNIAGKLLGYTVSGIYETVTNMGQGFRMTEDGYRRGEPGHKGNIFIIKLVDNSAQSKTNFIAGMEKKYGEGVDAKDSSIVMAPMIDAITRGIRQVLAMIFILFAIVAMAMMANATSMELHENRKTFGIYKTMGMTPSQIRMIMSLKTALAAFAGTMMALVLELCLHTTLLRAALEMFGIATVELTVNIPVTAAVIVLFTVLCAASSWVSSRSAKNIQARSLVLE